MPAPDAPIDKCGLCGQPMPASAARCPRCKQPRKQQGLRPLGGELGPAPAIPPPSTPRPPRSLSERLQDDDSLYTVEPLPPAPGQEELGTLASIKLIVRDDRTFAALLLVLALQMLFQAVFVHPVWAALSAIALWGVLTLTWWGYWLALALNTIYLAVMVLALVPVAITRPDAAQAAIPRLALPLALSIFVIAVLVKRKQQFD